MSNKTEMIEAAKSAFRKYGFQKTTLDDVAKECGVQKTAIYYYFKSKDDLIQNTMEYMIEEIIAECDKAYDAKKTMETNLYVFMKVQLETFLEHKKFTKVIESVDIPFKYIELAHRIKVILVDYLIRSYKKIMNEAIQENRISLKYIDTAISILIGAVFSYLADALFENKEINFEETINNTLHVVLKGIEI